jgi:hypothetical protein
MHANNTGAVLLTAAAMDALSLLELAMLQRVSSVHALDHTAAGVGGSLGGAIVVPLALVCWRCSHCGDQNHAPTSPAQIQHARTALRISVIKVDHSRLAVESGSRWARECKWTGRSYELARARTSGIGLASEKFKFANHCSNNNRDWNPCIRIFVDPQSS